MVWYCTVVWSTLSRDRSPKVHVTQHTFHLIISKTHKLLLEFTQNISQPKKSNGKKPKRRFPIPENAALVTTAINIDNATCSCGSEASPLNVPCTWCLLPYKQYYSYERSTNTHTHPFTSTGNSDNSSTTTVTITTILYSSHTSTHATSWQDWEGTWTTAKSLLQKNLERFKSHQSYFRQLVALYSSPTTD